MKEKALFFWSGGKDSALALHTVLKENKYDIIALITTINSEFKRISMHGVREELADMQAESIGLPLIKMYVKEGTNQEYEKEIEQLLLKYKAKGVTKVLFGDIFLEDLRKYREDNLVKVGLTAQFPLWKRNTKELIKEFLDLGFKTITCCVNDAYLNESRVGVEIDENFINTLPDNVDACGENGEYHTFCFAGPIFKKPIEFIIGEKVYKPLSLKSIESAVETKGFWYIDLLKKI